MAGKSKIASPENSVQVDDAGTVAGTTTINDGIPAGTVIDTATINDGTPAGTVVDTATINDGTPAGTVIDTTTISDGTVVPEVEMENTRRAVAFLGPYHRYSRGDIACFDSEYAQQLVARRIAVWPEDAKRALNPRQGDDDHATDIG